MSRSMSWLVILVLPLGAPMAGTASADDYQVIYSEDFSVDPCWSTNSPNNFYHDPSEGAYFMHLERALEPWEYVKIPIGPLCGSFKLEYDVKLTGITWAGGFELGVFSPNMQRDEPMVRGSLVNPDEGNGITVAYVNIEGGQASVDNYDPTHEIGVWYHAVLTYNEPNSTIDFEIYRKSDGANQHTVGATDCGPFYPSNMGYVGATTHGLTPYVGRYAEGYIDNVELSVIVDWKVIYTEDFSHPNGPDPSWDTNEANNFYHDPNEGAYFIHLERALTPFQYTKVPVGSILGSFKLEYDVKLTGITWAGGFELGVFSPNMQRDEPMVRGSLVNPDEGNGITVAYVNIEGGQASVDNYDPTHEIGVWYHATLTYNEHLSTIDFQIYRKSDGANLYSVQATDCGPFYPSNMGYVGATTHGLTPYVGKYAEGYIDNVQLSVVLHYGVVTKPVYLDIKPGSCPNPLNRKSQGVLPVAILGTQGFDVSAIDANSILLTREGVESGAAPVEVSIEDMATPFEGEPCECHELGADGEPDLVIKFRTQDVVAALDLDSLSPGEEVLLTVTGNLLDGSAFTGSDCVWLVPPHALRINVRNDRYGHVELDPVPSDPNLPQYPLGAAVTLTAVPEAGKAFKQWQIFDADHPGDASFAVTDANNPITIVMDGDREVTASFGCGSGVGPMLPMIAVVLGLLLLIRRRA